MRNIEDNNNQVKIEKNKTNLKKELYKRLIVLIILLLLVVITSFNTGRKFYLLKNTYFENSKGEIHSDVARWNFNARIIIGNEVENE